MRFAQALPLIVFSLFGVLLAMPTLSVAQESHLSTEKLDFMVATALEAAATLNSNDCTAHVTSQNAKDEGCCMLEVNDGCYTEYDKQTCENPTKDKEGHCCLPKPLGYKIQTCGNMPRENCANMCMNQCNKSAPGESTCDGRQQAKYSYGGFYKGAKCVFGIVDDTFNIKKGNCQK